MEMHQIRYFLKVAETLNFTRAAEQCFVAQPSLTRAIKKLEEELGGDLFHREGRRTHLTNLGQMMRPLLTQSFESAICAKEQADSYGKSDIAHLRLGLSNSFELQLLRPMLDELIRVMPDLEVTLVRGTAQEIEQLLEDGDFDLAITAKGDEGWERINQTQLFREEFVVAFNAAHSLSHKQTVKLDDLQDQNIVRRTHCEGFGDFPKLLDQHQIKARFPHSVTTEHDLEFLLSCNLGIGVVPRSIEFSNTDLVRREIEDAEYLRTVYLLAVAGRKLSKPGLLFTRLLRAKDWSAHVLDT